MLHKIARRKKTIYIYVNNARLNTFLKTSNPTSLPPSSATRTRLKSYFRCISIENTKGAQAIETALEATLASVNVAGDLHDEWRGFTLPSSVELIPVPKKALSCTDIEDYYDGEINRQEFPALTMNAYVLAASQMVWFINGDMGAVEDVVRKQISRTYDAMSCYKKPSGKLMLPAAFLKEYVKVFRRELAMVTLDDSEAMKIVTSYPSIEDIPRIARNGWKNYPEVVLYMTSIASDGDPRMLFSFDDGLEKIPWDDYLSTDHWQSYIQSPRTLTTDICDAGFEYVEGTIRRICCSSKCVVLDRDQVERSIKK